MMQSGEAKRNPEIWREKNDTFNEGWRNVYIKIDDHRTLSNVLSTISEIDIDTRATEKDILSEYVTLRAIGKKYTKARVYYKPVDHRYIRGQASNIDGFPYLGVSLVCVLVFDDRSFKFEIAKSTKGYSKLNSHQLDIKNLTITNQRKEIKFQSLEKFEEILTFCERVIELTNKAVTGANLDKLARNIEICENQTM